MMKRVRNRRVDARRGAATVEFALVAPLLFLLIFLMFESSRFLMGLHATTGAAREAVRIYSVRGDEASARSAAEQFLRQRSFNVENLVVKFEKLDSDVPGMEISECTVQVDYEDVSLVGDPFNLGASHVRGYSSMLTPE